MGPAVCEKEDYASGGQGYYMADFLASRMYDKILSVRQCVVLAAYVLFQAKEHVDGCGGDSHIAVLREDGTSGKMHWDNVESVTKLVKESDRQFGEIVMHYANLSITKEDFIKESQKALESLADWRERERQNLGRNKEFWDIFFGQEVHDELGLPTPPTKMKKLMDGE